MRQNQEHFCRYIATEVQQRIVVLRGEVVQHYYNKNGEKIASFELAPNTTQVAMSVPVGQWHALEEGSVILECKYGAYELLANCDMQTVV